MGLAVTELGGLLRPVGPMAMLATLALMRLASAWQALGQLGRHECHTVSNASPQATGQDFALAHSCLPTCLPKAEAVLGGPWAVACPPAWKLATRSPSKNRECVQAGWPPCQSQTQKPRPLAAQRCPGTHTWSGFTL